MSRLHDPQVVLDLRDLEPPGPMVEILQALARLAPGEMVEALMPRRPVMLLPKLEALGHAFELEDLPGGGCRICIIKAPGT